MHMLPFGVQIKPSYVDSPNLFNAATYIEKGSLVGRTRASYINTYYVYTAQQVPSTEYLMTMLLIIIIVVLCLLNYSGPNAFLNQTWGVGGGLGSEIKLSSVAHSTVPYPVLVMIKVVVVGRRVLGGNQHRWRIYPEFFLYTIINNIASLLISSSHPPRPHKHYSYNRLGNSIGIYVGR